VEIVAGRTEAEIARRERLFESSRRGRGGVADPWSAAQILDVRTWKLLARTLGSGSIKWLSAKHPLCFRLRRGESESFAVFAGSPIPITEQLFAQLLESSDDFRRALGSNAVREIERPR
jgi:hypothetical protein